MCDLEVRKCNLEGQNMCDLKGHKISDLKGHNISDLGAFYVNFCLSFYHFVGSTSHFEIQNIFCIGLLAKEGWEIHVPKLRF
jgi:hypothetical protein